MTTAWPPAAADCSALHVGEVAEGGDAGEIGAGEGQADGVGAGRQHQAVVAEPRAAREHHLALGGAQRRRRHRRRRRSMPWSANQAGGPQLDVGLLGLAREQARQQHAVVGRVRLLPDQHDLVAAGAERHDLLDQPSAAMPPPTMTSRSRGRLRVGWVNPGAKPGADPTLGSGLVDRVGSSLRSTQPTIRTGARRCPWAPAWLLLPRQ